MVDFALASPAGMGPEPVRANQRQTIAIEGNHCLRFPQLNRPGIKSQLLIADNGRQDGPWVCAGSDYEVAFQLSLVAVIDNINAGIDIVVYFTLA